MESIEWPSWMGPGRAQPQTYCLGSYLHVPRPPPLAHSWLLVSHLSRAFYQTPEPHPPSLSPAFFPFHSMFLHVLCSWSPLHSFALNLILLFPVPYFLNSPGPFSFISPSSPVPFAAPAAQLLSSADLISVVDDPSLPDWRLSRGMGGSRKGRLHSTMCTGS